MAAAARWSVAASASRAVAAAPTRTRTQARGAALATLAMAGTPLVVGAVQYCVRCVALRCDG